MQPGEGVYESFAIRFKLTRKSFALLKRLGRIRATVYLEVGQSDSYGLFTHDWKVRVTLLKPKA
jgi:hypothetical protein